MPDLSIIIPIYNTAADALTRCFDSLATLEGINWEAILVDDGSQEAVGTHCRQYATAHPNFSYVYKENGGASSARNLGLEYACGEYIMFVDADDVLLGAPIVQAFSGSMADLTVFDMQLCENGHEHTWCSLPVEAGAVSREYFLEQLIRTKDLNSPCIKLFRRSIIRERALRFRTNFVAGEDWSFVTDFSLCTGSFRYVKQPCYLYIRDGATVTSRLSKHPDTMLENYLAIFAKKMEIIAAGNWSTQGRTALSVAAATCLVEDMVNAASALLLLKLLTPARKELITASIKKLDNKLLAMPKKTRWKANILLHAPWGLWPMAQLRAIYLKIKR